MALTAGARLGPYEIRGPLGAGGMGEVYRAWDPRLRREVAVKVLTATAVSDPNRRRRFEQEARAAGALNHPNVVAVYEVGSHDGVPYIVSEKLEGETLRQRLKVADLTPPRAVEIAAQVARGLAAAHARGMVHRDLKPENVFVCRDGVVKVLDFGLAKLRPEAEPSGASTTAGPTRSGVVLGTAAYMSPEQVRGLPVEPRSDIFSLGIVLYEMLGRRRPFEGGTSAEVQVAILGEEPPALPSIDSRVPAVLDHLVRRCLEKRPEDRFDTARDVALSLTALAGGPGEARAIGGDRPRPRVPAATMLVVLLGAAALGAGLATALRPLPTPPSYTQLTFRRGLVTGARFTPDGDTVVYSAAWNGAPSRLYSTRLDSPESRDLGIEGVLLSVSSKGDLAVKLGPLPGLDRVGTLARLSLSGGAPREIMNDALDADWDVEGRDLAVIHVVEERPRLEYPVGHVVYEPAGEIVSVRTLPSGNFSVFDYDANGGETPYRISVVDPKGGRKLLSPGWSDPAARATGWLPATGEILFAASDGPEAVLRAVSPKGRARVVARIPGDFLFLDVDARGRVLLSRSFAAARVLAKPPGEAAERDLAWLDFSYLVDLSADGRQILLAEQGGGMTAKGWIALRRTDGSPAVTLSEGGALALSPDGGLVLALPLQVASGDRLVVLPTGPGARRDLRHPSLPRIWNAGWFPDGKHIVVVAGSDEARWRLHVWDIDASAPPRPVSPEGDFERPVVAPDGRWIAARQVGVPLQLYAVDGGPPRPLPHASVEDRPLRWSDDGRFLFVRRGVGMPARIERVNVVTGARQLWKELQPADPTGVLGITSVRLTPDGKGYAYSFGSSLGALYLAEGLK